MQSLLKVETVRDPAMLTAVSMDEEIVNSSTLAVGVGWGAPATDLYVVGIGHISAVSDSDRGFRSEKSGRRCIQDKQNRAKD